jgi:indole-3-glycerol phosphate synthase
VETGAVILDEIVAWKRREVELRRAKRPLSALEKAPRSPARPFEKALRKPGTLAVLAEIKRASPSAGDIRPDVDIPAVASSMEKAGADALSVLTDEKYFKGSLADMALARASVSLGVLEKDFVIDEYQIHEAAASGADAILLIVRILTDAELARFFAVSKSIGLGCLVETHTSDDVRRAAAVGAGLIGINNRDLSTLRVDVATTLDLMPGVPAGAAVVSQSGISTPEQAKLLFEAGVSAIQVGESLMRAYDPGAGLRQLLSLIR